MELYKTDIEKTLKELEKIAEPSFNEIKTTQYIVSFLKKHNIPIDKILKTGCFGTIEAGKEKTIALRADIDALPIDNSGKNFAHLCGHHGHTAALLHTLKQAVLQKEKLNHNIRYIFQPAEEIGTGALFLIKEGAIYNVDEIYALHGDPNYSLGEIAIKQGELMAGSSLFKIEISGSSTHAAFPHKGNDVIIAAAEYMNICQKIISRFQNPVDEGVISFCKINGGTAANILPENVLLEGTFRFFSEATKRIIKNNMIKGLKLIEDFYNVTGKISFSHGTLPLVNDNGLCSKLIKIFSKSGITIKKDYEKMMGSEDFSYFLEKIPGVYIKAGIAVTEDYPPLHNKNFYLTSDAVLSFINIFSEIIFNK